MSFPIELTEHSSSEESYLTSVVAGGLSTLAITPVMTVVDMAIIRSQFQKQSLGQALRSTTADLLTKRTRWNPAFNIMWGAYAATYITANATRTACKDAGIDPHLPVALIPSLVNAVTIALKDRAYASLFTGSPKQFPVSSLLMFGFRDGFTISATFVLKDHVRDWLVGEKGVEYRQAEITASFGVPMVAQVFSTPFHVLALDRYERPDAPLRSRLARVAANFTSVTAGRMFRIIPAFGVGGYLNDRIRDTAEELSGLVSQDHDDEPLALGGGGLRRRTTIV